MMKALRTHSQKLSFNIADVVGINFGLCQEILTESLKMRCAAMKFVP
jgi:hypothetical protein